jgi:predicted nucleotidyltransferase
MGTVSLRETGIAFDEAQIVEALRFEVRPDAVILCGSRATGDAIATSDYDILVVLPSLRIPREVAKLSRIGDELSRTLDAPVSVNPLPRFRLRRPGRSFLVWKALHEGRTLWSPGVLVARRDGMPLDRASASTSYAVSGIRYLLAELDPAQLGADRLSPDVSRGVGKALLHAAQLQLLGSGRYAARLGDCLPLLDDGIRLRIGGLAGRLDEPDTWFATLRLLAPSISPQARSWRRALVEGAQYVALSRMRGASPPLRVVFLRGSLSGRFTRSTVALARAVEPDGHVDAVQLRAAVDELPAFLRPPESASWTDVRDLLEREWPQAQPLVGL